jgi:hypothetical protein
MRLWSIHPAYLDAKGLIALWREGLLAQSVLLGNTKGYKHHPQLIRFKNTINPVGAIAAYLRFVVDEADNRAYHFDRSKIVNKRYSGRISVNTGQITYEFSHLMGKLKTRAPELYSRLRKSKRIKVHPLFDEVHGGVEDWEIT